ncbi:universal stress protein [Streptomyces sp. NPDC006365]|uniref:universal stress protein n=1 Tax=Streptomyces sp. NPDC006365 TaxID=3364744 RepID=UPI0036B95A96
MSRTVTVGLDGSSESRAAAEWAAREAKLRGLPLRLVNVWEPVPEPMAQAPLLGAETQQHWSEWIPREAADGLRLRHSGVEVIVEQLTGRPSEMLSGVAKEAELMVLGSRGLSSVGGFLVGSVGQAVVAHTERPVVLVRSGEAAADEHVMDPAGVPSAATPYRRVVLGIDTQYPHDALIEFAIDAATRRATSLQVVHGFSLPPYFAYGLPDDPEFNSHVAAEWASALTEVLRPWRQKFPSLEIVEHSLVGKAADQLVAASRDASLVVVGRRIRRSPIGAHIGPVTHAVLHHAAVPVAVVPHD